MGSLSEVLRTASWAQALSEEEMTRAEAGTFERRVPAGALFCRKGEPVDCWIGVVEGLIKVSAISLSGRSATLTGVRAGGWFGEGSLLKTEPRRYDVVTLRDSRVAFMRRATFHWLLDHSLAFNRFVLTQLNERLGQFIAMVEYDRLLGPDARVARGLAWLFDPVLYPGGDDQLQISQEELGFLSGVSRQRVNQALKRLEEAKLLRVEYGGITVLDLGGLFKFGP